MLKQHIFFLGSDWDPDFELPDPFEQEPADESPDEGNYTFRQDIMPSQKDSQIEELEELSCEYPFS